MRYPSLFDFIKVAAGGLRRIRKDIGVTNDQSKRHYEYKCYQRQKRRLDI